MLSALAVLAAALPVVSIGHDRAITHERDVRATVSAPGYRGAAAIRHRGQSSLSFAKKSFRLELRDRRGKDRKAPLAGLPREADWVLAAAHADKTLLRNVVAYDAARAMGRYAPRTQLVELRRNGRREGVYVLTEHVELAKERVRGDVLLEWTFPFQARRKGPHFRTPVKRRPILFEEPSRKELGARRAARVQRAVAAAERALYGGGDWRRHLDEASLVDYVLVQELLRNVDAFHASTFLTWDGRRLAFGPVWDFDLSAANSWCCNSRATDGWWTDARDWGERLHRDEAFRRRLAARWRELRAGGFREAVLGSLDRHAALLRDSGAAGRNFRRWPVLSRRVFQEPELRGSHTAEVAFLRGWLERRMAWLDAAT